MTPLGQTRLFSFLPEPTRQAGGERLKGLRAPGKGGNVGIQAARDPHASPKHRNETIPPCDTLAVTDT